jgi:hypothetical protein
LSGGTSYKAVLVIDQKCLVDLRLANNRLENVPQLGNLVALKTIDFSHNHIRGEIPDFLWGLTCLQYVSFANNHIDGRLPTEIGNLPFLSELRFSHNCITGPIPNSLGHAVSLHVLDLSHNAFEQSIPADIGNLTALKVLDLQANRLCGEIPSTLGKLMSLQYLCWRLNPLLDCETAPASMRGFASIEVIIEDQKRQRRIIEIRIEDMISECYEQIKRAFFLAGVNISLFVGGMELNATDIWAQVHKIEHHTVIFLVSHFNSCIICELTVHDVEFVVARGKQRRDLLDADCGS